MTQLASCCGTQAWLRNECLLSEAKYAFRWTSAEDAGQPDFDFFFGLNTMSWMAWKCYSVWVPLVCGYERDFARIRKLGSYESRITHFPKVFPWRADVAEGNWKFWL